MKMKIILSVISDVKPNSPITQNLSFTDLDYLAELLMADTLALQEDFQRKSAAILEQEMRLHANVGKILALECEVKGLRASENILERDLCMVFNDIELLDQEVNKMDKDSSSYICKCLPKPNQSYLNVLLGISGTIEDIRKSVENASSEASHFSQSNSAFWTVVSKFISMYFKILENCEVRLLKCQDRIGEVSQALEAFHNPLKM
ncbi:hypothetical protein ACFFRR_000044 [Megaselia abdita]